MEITNKLQVSKKANLIVSFIVFWIDVAAFFTIFALLNYFFVNNDMYLNSDTIFYYALCFLLILLLAGGYSKRNIISISNNFKFIGIATISMPFTFNLFLYQFGFQLIQSDLLINLLYLSFSLVFSFRVLFIFYIRNSSFFRAKVVIVGDGKSEELFNEYEYLNVNSFESEIPPEEDPFFLNTVSRLLTGVDRVLLDFKSTKGADRYVNIVSSTSNDIEFMRRLNRLPVSSIQSFNGYQTLKLKTYGSDFKAMLKKRLFDLTLVLITSPIWLLILTICAVLIKIDSPGPIFFKQQRIGLKNQFFNIYKFRTMYHEHTDHSGSKLTEKNDIRVTKFGKFLRKSSLDELPQLFNILKLEMSLVGPRPSTLEAKAGGKNYWDKFPEYWKRHMILPGMTGLAQIRGLRGNTFTKDDLLMRYQSDIEYLNNANILLDIKIIFLTFFSLFSDESF